MTLSNTTIRDVFGCGAIPHNDSYVKRLFHDYDGHPKVKSDAYFGIEVEVEYIHAKNQIAYDTEGNFLWNNIEDGSLRNNGREFVSIPLPHYYVKPSLEKLLVTLSNNPKTAGFEFSDRTSVHVHVGCNNMTVQQLQGFILSYLVLEPLLYSFCGGDRHRNIFCIPVNEAKIMQNQIGQFIKANESNYKTKLDSITRVWKKYLGFNLMPLRTKGTVEFRHMPGTLDIEKLSNWVDIIAELKLFAETHTVEYILNSVKTLNSTSRYLEFIISALPTTHHHITSGDIQKHMEEMIMFVKCCLTKEAVYKLEVDYADSPLYSLALRIGDLKKEKSVEGSKKANVNIDMNEWDIPELEAHFNQLNQQGIERLLNEANNIPVQARVARR